MLALGALVILTISVAYRLGKDQEPEPEINADEAIAKDEASSSGWSEPTKFRDGRVVNHAGNQRAVQSRAPRSIQDDASTAVIEDEIILHFDDRLTYDEALRLLTEAGVPLRGGIRSLSMLRVELPPGGLARLEKVLGERIAGNSRNHRVEMPQPIDEPTVGGLTPFGDDWLAQLGVPDDNADWGKGVKVAVIDTGVTRHQGLNGARINRIALVEELVGSGHGNAVTSIIVGNGEPGYARGLAPGAEVLAFQAMGAESGDSFTIAEAIVDAVDRGADIVNLSLGGWGDSVAVQQAVAYADQAGAVVVAAVGNDRHDQIQFPAAYDGVIAVTAVDSQGQWAEFPNAGLDGRWPDIAAPGVGLPAAYADDQNIAFSGTSAAAPAVSAAIAAHMSQTGSSAKESAAVVIGQASDRGEPGADPYLGAGVLDITRIMRADERGVYDLAVSDHYVDVALANDAGLPVRIGVQNRGTETVRQPVLTLMLGTQDNRSQIPLQALAPGEIAEYEALIPVEYFQSGTPAAIGAIIDFQEADDVNRDNNVIVSAYGVTHNEDGELEFIEARQE